MIKLRSKTIAGLALAVASITALAACSSNSSSSASATPSGSSGIGLLQGQYGKVPAQAAGTQHAGTITMAEPPNSAPTWILPIVTGAANSVYTVSMFDYSMWRPLYWFYHGVEPTETPAMSLANQPTWTNGNKTVTFTLKPNYKWSNGQPITSKDVLFWWYEMKAAIKASPANWAYYTPTLGIPDQVTSISAPNSTTVQMNLNKSVNPTWFWQNQLGAIQPMPSQAWAKSSASGPDPGLHREPGERHRHLQLPRGAVQVGVQLREQSALAGRRRAVQAEFLQQHQRRLHHGAQHDVRRTARDRESTINAVSFTSDDAEFNAVKAGKIDVGYVPLTDVPQLSTISGTYNQFGYPASGGTTWRTTSRTPQGTSTTSSTSCTSGRPSRTSKTAGYINAFFNNAGGEAYGPVPSSPQSPYTPSNATTNPYPYSTARPRRPS